MTIVRVPNAGSVGVNKDLSQHELPINAWTDASNIRFLDGYASQFFGHGEVYNSASATPQHVMPVNVAGVRYWIYATASKCYCVTNSGGVAVHTDITHATPRTGVVNAWTGCLFNGLPILSTGDTSKVPMYWDLNTSHKFVDLPNWPVATYCKALRAYNNFLIALNLNKSGTAYPFDVLWSTQADPGTYPSSWDITDATKNAGESSLSDGYDQIVNGLQLRNSFMIYKEASTWRMDFTGGPYVFQFSKVLGTSGAMNVNCVVDIDGYHVVLGNSDVIVHDGQSGNSVLDKETRRYLFQNIDATNANLCFVAKNPFFNEVWVCYPSIGASVCDTAMVWNYKDKTCTFRSLPNLNHMNFGPVDNSLAGNWNQDSAPWSSDLTTWNGGDYVPSAVRTIAGSSDGKLYMMDASASFNGSLPSAYLERQGLSFDAPEQIKLVRGIRPRITGNVGDTVLVYVGASNDPFTAPTYGSAMTHTIGTTISNDCLVSGRYIAVKFATGTAYQWRLDSWDADVETAGLW